MNKIEKAIKAGEARAAEFAKNFPVGTPCIYFPTMPFKDIEADEVTIRSDPWVLGHGAVVVAITGRTGGVLIDHIKRTL
jgi:hypothetical protein